MSADHTNRTTLVIGNIHCPSCVAKIESIFAGYNTSDEKHRSSARRSLDRIVGHLSPHSRSSSPSSSTLVDEEYAENKLFTPAFTRVDVSPINGTVSFNHSPDASIRLLIAELEDAGFDVIKTDAINVNRTDARRRLHSDSAGQSRWSRFSDLFTFAKDRQKAHIDNCEACREEEDARTRRSERVAEDVGHVSSDARDEIAVVEERRGRDRSVHRRKPAVQAVLAIDGMTCASCISAIESALAPGKTPGITSVQVVLVDNSATVVYDPSVITEEQIIEHIEDSGYGANLISSKPVPGSPSSTPVGLRSKGKSPDSAISAQRRYRVNLSVGGMTCASCVSSISNMLKNFKGVKDYNVDLMGGSAYAVVEDEAMAQTIASEIEDLGYEAKVMDIEDLSTKSMYRVKLSIGGMTCASCVGTIGNMLKNLAGVKDYNVDLMGGSGSALVEDKAMAEITVKEIEDLGYEAKVMAVEEVKGDGAATGEEETKLRARTVHVKIEGFFCEHCPAKANKVLQDMSKRFDISYTSSTLEDPASTLTYTANPPEFTLRTIRRAIAELGFTLSVVKPETSSDRARQAQKRERRRILIRLAICIVFCIPTFLIGVVFASLLPEHSRLRMYWHHPIWGGASRMTIALFCLATPIQFGIGQFFYERAYKSLRGVWRKRRGKIDKKRVWIDRLLRWGSMDTLVALGTTIAWASSLAYMILDIVGLGSGEMAYFDTSVFLMTFILAGRYLESISKARTGDAITELGKLRPKKGLLYEDGQATEEVASDFIEVGDRLLVPVGMSPPVDCRLAEGSPTTSFDEASLTGESRPVGKKVGDTVYAGTYNTGPSAAIVITETHDGETVIDSIASGVRDAMSKKASIERFADAVTAVFVPFIVGASCIVFILWMIRAYSGHLPAEWLDDQKAGGWTLFALQFTVATLIVACPCGLGLAAPTAQYVGVGLAARNGIMPNGGGEAFQSFTHIDAIAFDKTGTITMGKFRVSDEELADILPENDLWAVVSAIEQASNHPVARAIHLSAQEKLKSSADKNVADGPSILDMAEIPGRGMKAQVKLANGANYEALVGNEKMLTENGCDVSAGNSQLLQAWQGQGKSVVLVALKQSDDGETANFKVAALLAVADPLRPEASFVLDYFKSRGIATYIVSGDGPTTVKAVARTLNLPESRVIGGALPEDKRRFVQELQSQTKQVRGWNGRLQTKHKLVAFVGDGINDSIALAQADVSIAQGGGSQAAASTADFALVSESLLSIITLQAIARSTYRRIISNFCWACIYNIVLIPLAAGAFYDLGRTKLPAVWASLAMALSSVSVVMNSLLLRYTFRVPREVKRFRDQC